MSLAFVQEIGRLRTDLLKFAMPQLRNAAHAEDAILRRRECAQISRLGAEA